jgi:hypothetical protein
MNNKCSKKINPSKPCCCQKCSSSSSSCPSSSSSCSSSSTKYCKYPVVKYSPPYCPNNCCVPSCVPNYCNNYPVNHYPKNQYLTYPSVITASTFNILSNNSYTIYLFNNNSSDITINLPAIYTLNNCSYNKKLILCNLNALYNLIVNTQLTDTFNNSTATTTVLPNLTIELYATYISSTGIWVLLV